MVKITEVITEVEGGLGRSRRRSSSPGGLISNRGNPELALRGPGAKALGGSGGGRGGGTERQGRLGPQLQVIGAVRREWRRRAGQSRRLPEAVARTGVPGLGFAVRHARRSRVGALWD